jgi:hypothetical protein
MLKFCVNINLSVAELTHSLYDRYDEKALPVLLGASIKIYKNSNLSKINTKPVIDQGIGLDFRNKITGNLNETEVEA